MIRPELSDLQINNLKSKAEAKFYAACKDKLDDKYLILHSISWIHKNVVGDIRDEIIIEQISDVKADILIHLISLDHHDSEKKPNYVSDINVQPTWNLLEACTAKGLKKFIYFSTIHVYGKNQNGFIYEKQTITPFNEHHQSGATPVPSFHILKSILPA